VEQYEPLIIKRDDFGIVGGNDLGSFVNIEIGEGLLVGANDRDGEPVGIDEGKFVGIDDTEGLFDGI